MQHKCFKCGTEFDGNFCPECGEKWQENKTCPTCGATLAGNAKFCNQCGYSFVPKDRPQTPPPLAQKMTAVERKAVANYTRCLYFPSVLIALFSVLFFFLYLAPVAVMPGGELLGTTIPSESYGTIYQMMSGDIIPSLASSSIACIVFSALLLANALLCLYVAVIRHDPRNTLPLEILGDSFLVALLIISCVMMGIVGKEDGGMGFMKVGAAPILIIVFSSLTIALLVTTECIARFMARRSPMVAKAYDENFAMWQKKEEEKHFAREREKSERIRHYRETTAAPIPPQTTYRKNQREWAVYRYQVKRYEKGKPYQNISYPRIWCYTHRIALSVTSVILAAVITVTCVFALRDTRFRAENLIKIGLGADEKRVTEVLGEPFQKETNGWYYFSKNYASIMEKMEELEEQSKNISSYEEFEKLAEKSEKLQKELEGLEYQIIFISYSADGTVERMTLDTKAFDTMPSEKTITEVTISPTSYTLGSNTKVSYSIACDDGSYCMAYFSKSQLPTSKGEQTIEWYDTWGQCSATIFVY